MAIPHNEVTRRMAEEAMKALFDGKLTINGARAAIGLKPVLDYDLPIISACIPIIPPGQDDEEETKSEPPKDVGIPRDTFFEKRIKRVGGPPRAKPKPLFTPEPVAATPNPSDEWVHRAIGIAGQRR
jgi:hypothetical protein